MDRDMENRLDDELEQQETAEENAAEVLRDDPMELPPEEDDTRYFLTVLNFIEDTVRNARGMGGYKLVKESRLLDMISQLKDNLPDAIQYGLQMYSERERIMGNSEEEARLRITEAEKRASATISSAKKEEERILADANEEADAILADAKERADAMVSESEILIRAREEAHIIRNDAKVEANELRLKADHDVLQLLLGVEDELTDAYNGIVRRRKDLEARSNT